MATASPVPPPTPSPGQISTPSPVRPPTHSPIPVTPQPVVDNDRFAASYYVQWGTFVDNCDDVPVRMNATCLNNGMIEYENYFNNVDLCTTLPDDDSSIVCEYDPWDTIDGEQFGVIYVDCVGTSQEQVDLFVHVEPTQE